MKIVVGTTSQQKLEYLDEVLRELNLESEIISADVESEISEQPKTSKETKTGSYNRAKNSIAKHPEADFAIGIEIGYHPDKNDVYKMLGWATIVDKNGVTHSSRSRKITLPKFYQDLLKQDQYLCKHVELYLNMQTDPVMINIAKIFDNRQPFIKDAIKVVIVEYWLRLHGEI